MHGDERWPCSRYSENTVVAAGPVFSEYREHGRGAGSPRVWSTENTATPPGERSQPITISEESPWISSLPDKLP